MLDEKVLTRIRDRLRDREERAVELIVRPDTDSPDFSGSLAELARKIELASGGAIGVGSVKRDRFVALQASFDGGSVVTKPLTLAGTQLHLNTVSDFGEVLVTVHDASGKVVAVSEPVTADALDIPVTWAEGGIEGLDGPVTLAITLRNAKLFALWCT